MKAKKILLGLGVAITSILMMVVGILTFNKGDKKQSPDIVPPNNQGEISSEFKPTTYYFDEGEVNILSGSDSLVYNYDVNQTTSAPIAYEYIFSNANNRDMAVKIDEVVAKDGNGLDNVIVSYKWSNTTLYHIIT